MQENHEWPSYTPTEHEIPELKRTQVKVLTTNKSISFEFERFSSFSHLVRTLAYIKRFIHNCKRVDDRKSGSLSLEELNEARTHLIKISQNQSFTNDIKHLKKHHCVNPKSKICRFTPFLDNEEIVRVGGRLRHSKFDFNKKHPILLCGKHHLSKLIFRYEHIRQLHAGPQLLLYTVRQIYWVTNARNISRQIVHACIKCFKHNAQPQSVIMGNLPQTRLQITYPFFVTGVDYAGPFIIKDRKGRGTKTSKAYISLFICFSTKALHLELVTDLTTQCFLDCYKRFVARRGKPQHIYSDNGTNFRGAASQLKLMGDFLHKNAKTITNSVNFEGTEWHFIPSHSPHFGGLWEAGVKSIKHHLKRVISNTPLTYEEFYTLLTRIEAILNSRPLYPMSSDPNDLEVLTPAHFLIGRPLTSVAERDVRDLKINRLTRYQHLQQMVQHIWSRWAKEYVSELQQRTKWRTSGANIKAGTMVIIKDDNNPPSRWQLGRVIDIHPGSDGVVRVVTVKTASGVLKRAVMKVCALPIEND